MSQTHYTIPYLLNPQHKITINLVGIGGTGSQVLSSLARMHKGLQALGHPGLHVRAFDMDRVSQANIGRQLFSPADLHQNKAVVAITRINRFFGYNWEAYNTAFDGGESANITITCIDTAEGRLKIAAALRKAEMKVPEPLHMRYYWLDFGNLKTTGQVVLGTLMGVYPERQAKEKKEFTPVNLPCVDELFDLTAIDEKDQGPSCSLAEAIAKQDLFINSTLAQLGCNLLWKLFTDGKLDFQGLYLNLENMQTRPIKLI